MADEIKTVESGETGSDGADSSNPTTLEIAGLGSVTAEQVKRWKEQADGSRKMHEEYGAVIDVLKKNKVNTKALVETLQKKDDVVKEESRMDESRSVSSDVQAAIQREFANRDMAAAERQHFADVQANEAKLAAIVASVAGTNPDMAQLVSGYAYKLWDESRTMYPDGHILSGSVRAPLSAAALETLEKKIGEVYGKVKASALGAIAGAARPGMKSVGTPGASGGAIKPEKPLSQLPANERAAKISASYAAILAARAGTG